MTEEHKLEHSPSGEGVGAYRIPSCRCGWIGNKVGNWNDRGMDMMKYQHECHVKEAEETILVCPYCGDIKEIDELMCCGESSGHFEEMTMAEYEAES